MFTCFNAQKARFSLCLILNAQFTGGGRSILITGVLINTGNKYWTHEEKRVQKGMESQKKQLKSVSIQKAILLSWWVKAKKLAQDYCNLIAVNVMSLITDVFLNGWMFQWAPLGSLSGSGKNIKRIKSQKINHKSCPRAKGHSWRASERTGMTSVDVITHPKNTTPTVKFRRWEHHRVGLFFCITVPADLM